MIMTDQTHIKKSNATCQKPCFQVIRYKRTTSHRLLLYEAFRFGLQRKKQNIMGKCKTT